MAPKGKKKKIRKPQSQPRPGSEAKMQPQPVFDYPEVIYNQPIVIRRSGRSVQPPSKRGTQQREDDGGALGGGQHSHSDP